MTNLETIRTMYNFDHISIMVRFERVDDPNVHERYAVVDETDGECFGWVQRSTADATHWSAIGVSSDPMFDGCLLGLDFVDAEEAADEVMEVAR